MAIHAYTSFAYGDLDRARVLARSQKTLHPDWVLWAVIPDRVPEGVHFDLADEDFDHLLTAEDLFSENAGSWLFGRDWSEASRVVKGKAALDILARPDCEKLFYFDPGVVLVNDMNAVVVLLDMAPIVLTPLQTEPEPGATPGSGNSAMKDMMLPLGFIAMANDEEGRRFAAWWDERLRNGGGDQPDAGVSIDRELCQLVPLSFDNVKILQDPGYNVASWNLGQRKMTFDENGQACINDQPLRFFHFARPDAESDSTLQRHARDNTEVYELWWWYRQQLQSMSSPDIPKG